MVSGSHEGQSPTVPSCDETGHRHGFGKPEYRHSAWHVKQCNETGWTKEIGVNYMRYLVIVEKGPTSFGAHVPDLPGCIAVGSTRDEALALIREAIEFHVEGLKHDGVPVPPPSSTSELVDVAA